MAALLLLGAGTTGAAAGGRGEPTVPPRVKLTVRGTVFADHDGDGKFSGGDAPVPGVRVVFGTTLDTFTDAQGRYTLTPPRAGIVWARSPDGFEPGPAWGRVQSLTGIAVTLDLPLVPATASGPAVFVAATDTHLYTVAPEELAHALTQATAGEPPPHFVAVSGDILAGTPTSSGYHPFDQVVAALPSPVATVPGNHDVEDGGAQYRERFGPSSWSFDSGGVHVLALDYGAALSSLLDFVAADLASVERDRPVVVLAHRIDADKAALMLSVAGVDYAFTGDLHENRAIRRGWLMDYSTEPIAIGGLDYTPAGYRVAALHDGQLEVTHHTVVSEPVAHLVSPADGSCVPPGTVPLIAAVERGPVRPAVQVSLDGSPVIPLDRVGGWDYARKLGITSPGPHSLRLEVRGGRDVTPQVERIRFCTQAVAEPDRELDDWPQLQGSAVHHGVARAPLTPPLRVAWVRSVGGHLRGGSPALADGRLFVPVVDPADGAAGGIVALDARSGEVLWEERTGASVPNAPAAVDGRVVFAGVDGKVHARDAATGAVVWTVDLGAGASEAVSWLHAAPTVDAGTVYIGLQHNLAAIELATGAVRWRTDPTPKDTDQATYASVSAANGIGVVALEKGLHGLFGFALADGTELWRLGPETAIYIHATPLLDGATVYLVTMDDLVLAVDRHSGSPLWSRDLDDYAGGDFLTEPFATPALAGGRLFVAGPGDGITAVDVASGEILWRRGTRPGVLAAVPYSTGGDAGVLASPVVTGDLVWAGGLDGVLRALDVASGQVRWSTDLGVPILTGPVPSGGRLFVGTYDGTVRALVEVEGVAGERCLCGGAPEGEAGLDGGGCRVAPGRAVGGTVVALVAAAVALGALAGLRRRGRGRARVATRGARAR